jgi:hypothetical protein
MGEDIAFISIAKKITTAIADSANSKLMNSLPSSTSRPLVIPFSARPMFSPNSRL